MNKKQRAKNRGGKSAKPTPDPTNTASPHPPLSPFPPVPTSPPSTSPLTRSEKRLLLAQIIRLNPLDCPDDSGSFNLARARRTLPGAAVQDITIHETTCTDCQGKVTFYRKTHVRLVDKLRALKLDDDRPCRRKPSAPTQKKKPNRSSTAR